VRQERILVSGTLQPSPVHEGFILEFSVENGEVVSHFLSNIGMRKLNRLPPWLFPLASCDE
jgi:hypothetical protein